MLEVEAAVAATVRDFVATIGIARLPRRDSWRGLREWVQGSSLPHSGLSLMTSRLSALPEHNRVLQEHWDAHPTHSGEGSETDALDE